MSRRVAAGVSLNSILILAALVLGVLALLGVFSPVFLLAIAVILLSLALLI